MEMIINSVEAKNRVVFRVGNYDKMADYIRKNDIAHEKEGDLVKIYGFELSGLKAPGIADDAVTVGVMTNSMVRQVGLTMDELNDRAMENMRRLRPLKITSIVQQLMELAPGLNDLRDPEMEGIPVMVVTNTSGSQGAAAVFYPEVEDELKARLGGDFYILPSSVHEVLAVRKDVNDLESLRMRVKTINETEVEPQDRLSDNVYEMSGGKLCIALTEREKEMERDKEMTDIKAVKRIAGSRCALGSQGSGLENSRKGEASEC